MKSNTIKLYLNSMEREELSSLLKSNSVLSSLFKNPTPEVSDLDISNIYTILQKKSSENTIDYDVYSSLLNKFEQLNLMIM